MNSSGWMWWATAALLTMGGPARATEPEGVGDVAALISERMGERVDEDALLRSALSGMTWYLNELVGEDANAILTTEQHAQHVAWQAGYRDGIGVEFSIVSGQGLLFTDVFEGGPGEQSGLRVGDLVIAINGTSLTGRSGAEIHGLVTQTLSDQMILDVRRAAREIKRFSVQRGAYRVSGLRLVEGKDPPLIRLPFFGEGVADQLGGLLDGLSDQSVIVLDLRDNDGGQLEELVGVASLFLEPGSVVAELVGMGRVPEPLVATGERRWAGRVVLLANRGTAGLAEGFMASMIEHQAAVAVGTRTRGQASIPSFYPLEGGLVLQLADTQMRSPTGRAWGGDGLEPSLLVEPIELIFPVPGRVPPDLQCEAAYRLIDSW